MEETEIGTVSHFFNKINVAVIKLSTDVKIGEHLHFRGSNVDFEQNLESMQIEHEKVSKAKSGESIGLKVKDAVREGDKVYRIIE